MILMIKQNNSLKINLSKKSLSKSKDTYKPAQINHFKKRLNLMQMRATNFNHKDNFKTSTIHSKLKIRIINQKNNIINR